MLQSGTSKLEKIGRRFSRLRQIFSSFTKQLYKAALQSSLA
jgi:hypothetical protein